jgi:hypothetical protein
VDGLKVGLLVHLDRAPGSSRSSCQREWRTVLLPLLDVVEGAPGLRLGLALGGDWIADLSEHRPDAIHRIRALARSGRLELLAAVGHGPIAPLIPERDLVAQVKRARTSVLATFGVTATGAWLPHGLWTPEAPAAFVRGGVAWVPLSDRATRAASLDRAPVAWVTERHGHALRLLVVDEEGSALAATGDAEAMQVLLDRRRAEGHRASVWWVGAAGGPAGVARLIGRAAFQTVPPSSLVEGHLRRAYVPGWAPPEIGTAEEHLLRCDAADRLHKRMLRVSVRVRRSEEDGRAEQARRYLHRAQHGAAYLEFDGGGALDPAVRRRCWSDLIRAEQALGAAAVRATVRAVDVDADGLAELVLSTPELEVVVDPVVGGGVTELVHRGAGTNLVDTVTRTPRPVHAQMPQSLFAGGDWDEPPTLLGSLPTGGRARAEAALERAVGWDRRPRASFTELFIGDGVRQDDLRRGRLDEPGWFGAWDVVSAEPRGDGAAVARLARTGPVADRDGVRTVRVHKQIAVIGATRTVRVTWEVANRAIEPLRTRLLGCVDLTPGDISGLVVDLGTAGTRSAARAGASEGVERVDLHGGGMPLMLKFDPPANLWHHPVATVDRRRGKWRVGLQALAIHPWWPVVLWEGDSARFSVELRLGEGTR